MELPLEEKFVSAGYYITRPVPRPEYLSPALMPSQILSASDCLVPVIPQSWSFNWLPERDLQDRLRETAGFGILPEQTLPLCQRITELEIAGKVGFDRTFFALETARGIAREFIPGGQSEVVILGLGLPQRYVENILELTGSGPTGMYEAISARQPLSPGGEKLGYDVTGYGEYGEFHSWLCGSLEDEVYQQFGIKAGKLGLLKTFEQASQIATYIQEANDQFEGISQGTPDEQYRQQQPVPSMKGEPGLWLPWLVVRYNFEPGL